MAQTKMTPEEIKKRFMQLTGELSPENLTCDGELSRTQINAKYRKIMAEWKQLEKAYGSQVTEDEVWNWILEPRRTAKGPFDPL